MKSITRASREATGKQHARGHNAWRFNGRDLGDIYAETYPWNAYHDS